MKKLIPSLIIATVLVLFSVSPAQAGHSHYNGCGHSGYGYHSYGGGYHNYGYNYRRPYYGYSSYSHPYYGYNSYRRPYYRDYYHDHYYRGSSYRCHFYGGRHYYNYSPYYRPRTNVHIGIGIFR
jgi:hypothetical protein